MSDEDHIVRVACTLCLAEGYDPEERVYVGSKNIEEGGTTYQRRVMAPAWTTYVDEARCYIAAERALDLLQ